MKKRSFTIQKENGEKIPCIECIPEDCRTIVIVVHGFCSSKESSNAACQFRELVPRGIGVIAYDQPGHGSAEASKETLRIDACLDSLACVEHYLQEAYPSAEICYFGSSFGAYVTGLYLTHRVHAGNKVFFRCPAVNFPDLILEAPAMKPGSPELAELAEKGYCDLVLGGDDCIRIVPAFLEDLKRYDLFDAFDANASGADHTEGFRIRMAHGEADPVVPVAQARRFAERFQIPLTTFPGEGHTISDDPASPPAVSALAAELFLEA